MTNGKSNITSSSWKTSPNVLGHRGVGSKDIGNRLGPHKGMDRYLTVKELSEYIKRSPGAIRNLVLRRKIPFRKPGGRLLFDLEEIDAWVNESEGVSFEKIWSRKPTL